MYRVCGLGLCLSGIHSLCLSGIHIDLYIGEVHIDMYIGEERPDNGRVRMYLTHAHTHTHTHTHTNTQVKSDLITAEASLILQRNVALGTRKTLLHTFITTHIHYYTHSLLHTFITTHIHYYTHSAQRRIGYSQNPKLNPKNVLSYLAATASKHSVWPYTSV
jgi:hypothetical protein